MPRPTKEQKQIVEWQRLYTETLKERNDTLRQLEAEKQELQKCMSEKQLLVEKLGQIRDATTLYLKVRYDQDVFATYDMEANKPVDVPDEVRLLRHLHGITNV
jgi:hypothetical protein